MSKFDHLPCATYPKPDELLTSWLTRLAHDHLLKTHTFGRMLFPGANVWNTDLDKSAPTGMLHALAERTGTPLGRVEQTVLRRYEDRLYARAGSARITPWLMPLGIYHRTRRYYGLLFCPQCLQKDGAAPYFRTHWRLALMHICTQCKVHLLDRCPECERPVIFFRVELGRKSALADRPISHCFHCGLNLATIVGRPATTSALAAQVEFERIMYEGWNKQVFYPHLYFSVLRQLVKQLINVRLPSAAFQRAVNTETGWSPLEEAASIRKNRTPVELLPLEVRSGVIQQAQWLLTEWPYRFIDITRRHGVTSTPFLYAMDNIPFWFYKVVLENLYVGRYFQTFLPKKSYMDNKEI